MKLKCRIHEQDYDIVTGATFSEEYNETLDSGTIVLDHISKIKDLKPYDDVYIWDADDEFNGYYNVGDVIKVNNPEYDLNISIQSNLVNTEEGSGGIVSTTTQVSTRAIAQEEFTPPATPRYYATRIINYDGEYISATSSNLGQNVTDVTIVDNENGTVTVTLYSNTYKALVTADITIQSRVENIINAYVEFTSNYGFGGSLYGRMIDIWTYCFFDNPSNPRFTLLDNIRIKVDMFLIDDPDYQCSEVVYELPNTPTGNLRTNENGETEIRLKLISGGTGDQSPNYAWVKIFRTISSFKESYKNTIKNTLSFNNVFIDAESEDYQYQLNNFIELIPNEVDGVEAPWRYKQKQIKTTLTLTISGATEDEFFGMRNLSINGLVQGTYFSLPLSTIQRRSYGNIIDVLFTGSFYKTNEQGIQVEQKCSLHGNATSTGTNEWQIVLDTCLLDGHKIQGGSFLYDSISLMQIWLDTVENTFDDVEIALSRPTNEEDRPGFYRPNFYKHMLVDSFTAEMVDLDKRNYKYKISLMSETKGLEKTVLPNISITQPIVVTAQKRTILYYLEQYLRLYSPKIKKQYGLNTWKYVNKYMLDARKPTDIDGNNPYDPYIKIPLSAIFTENDFAPEMSLTAPSLRDIISRLMIVKDCIPVVKDGVIYAMRISDTHGNFVVSNKHINFVFENMNSSEYSTAFRQEHGGAISQRESAHRVEYLGFRNSSEPLLTLDNMRLETQFPIYKINKIYMCYYKDIDVRNIDTDQVYTKRVFVEQDITPLVLQNTVRDALPADWTQYPNEINSYDDMGKYKILTVGYDIGSKTITGWGQKYTYIGDLLGWMNETETYIETILNLIDGFFPLGVGRLNILDSREILETTPTVADIVSPVQGLDELFKNKIVGNISTYISFFNEISTSNLATKFKSLVFKVDYNAMYEGTIIHTKDNTDDDDYMTTDNQSSALSILEVDGLYEKEKINRLGNAVINFTGRYDSFEQMNNDENHEGFNNVLGALYHDEFNEEVVIYHREYQIYDDVVLANFVGMYEYVMKNYYTTVFAKYRTYSYASYNESVRRNENDRYNVVLSFTTQNYEDNQNTIRSIELLSAFKTSSIDDKLKITNFNSINGGYFSFDDDNQYFADVNSFVSGYSLCFNITMSDALTTGLYIRTINCFRDHIQKKNYLGSAQEWYVMPVNSQADGFLANVGCYFGHFEDSDIISDDINVSPEELTQEFMNLPYKDRTPTNYFGNVYNFCKDNKEIINFTLQYEYVNYDKDSIYFTEWLGRLTNFSNFIKLEEQQEIPNMDVNKTSFRIFSGFKDNRPTMVVRYSDAINIDDVLNNDIVLTTNTRASFTHIIYDLTGSGDNMYYIAVGYNYVKYNPQIILKRDNQLFLKVLRTKGMVIDGRIVGNGSWVLEEIYIDLPLTTLSVGETGFIDLMCVDTDNTVRKNNYEIGFTFPSSSDWNSKLNMKSLNYADFVNKGIPFGSYTYPQTMYILTSSDNVDNHLTYPQFKGEVDEDYVMHISNLPSNYTLRRTIKVSDIFKPEIDEFGSPYILVDKSLIPEGAKSVQYWYFDYNPTSYPDNGSNKDDNTGNLGQYLPNSNGDGYLHFVFGVNLDAFEEGETTKKIYLSITKNRRKKVYDLYHREIGEVANTADSPAKYGTQFFTRKGSLVAPELIEIGEDYIKINNPNSIPVDLNINYSSSEEFKIENVPVGDIYLYIENVPGTLEPNEFDVSTQLVSVFDDYQQGVLFDPVYAWFSSDSYASDSENTVLLEASE